MPKNESEPELFVELFVELMYRFMSAKHRLRVAVNDIIATSHFVLQQHKPAYFVMQEATARFVISRRSCGVHARCKASR